MNENITLANLHAHLDERYGKKGWTRLEPETILLDLGYPGYLVMEKIYVLQVLNANVNHALSLPEFVLWATSVCNNELAEFDTLAIPTSLELAFLIEQAKKICLATSQIFVPSAEFVGTLSYLLSMDGFAESTPPFEFVPSDKINKEGYEVPPQATEMKQKAITAYIKHMEEIGHA